LFISTNEILNTNSFFSLSDKDKVVHEISDCEPKIELRDFDDLPMDDLDAINNMDGTFVYGDEIPSEKNIHQIDADLGYSQ
jgi:hypothetical protein